MPETPQPEQKHVEKHPVQQLTQEDYQQRMAKARSSSNTTNTDENAAKQENKPEAR